MIARCFLGDAALRLDVEAMPPLEGNAVVHRLAAALRGAPLAGVRDIVPGMTSLTVHVDPLRADLRAIEAVVATIEDEGTVGRAVGRRHEVAVRYGGVSGPDLDEVARLTGLAPAEVIAAHTAIDHHVCFLGFLPGFAYLGLVHESLRIRRRETPRTRVPAGSVAIADVFTGVYPAPSPGGWHLIGRTELPLFDISWPQPSRFAPGDTVRFVEA